MMHSDEAQDLQLIQPLVTAVEALISKVESIETRVDGMEKSLYDDLFGGIKKLYKENSRSLTHERLTGKYGEKFAPFQDVYSGISGGQDFFGTLADMRTDFAGTDDEFDAQVEQAIGKLEALADKLRKAGQPEAAEAVEQAADAMAGGEGAVAIEVEVEGKPEAEDMDKKIIERLKKSPSMRGI